MTTTTNPHVRKRRPVKLSDGSTIDMPDDFVSIVPVVHEIVCAAWDCDPERWSPVTPPLRIEGSLSDVQRELRRRGWRHFSHARGAWHCPTHAAHWTEA